MHRPPSRRSTRSRTLRPCLVLPPCQPLLMPTMVDPSLPITLPAHGAVTARVQRREPHPPDHQRTYHRTHHAPAHDQRRQHLGTHDAPSFLVTRLRAAALALAALSSSRAWMPL